MHQSPHGKGACSGVFLKTDTHNKSGICGWGGGGGGGSLHCPGRDKDILDGMECINFALQS